MRLSLAARWAAEELGAGSVNRGAGAPSKLAVFGGVREFPVRVKCASLCWHTLNAALAKQTQPVSTE